MKNETKTRARQRHADRWEEREAEAWDNIMKDLKPDEEPTVPPTVEAALNGQYKMKDLIKTAFSLKGDTADYEVIESRLNAGGRVSGMNLSILFFAILIASIGLNTNSTAVIIGAMLISPLMGTIQLMGLGIATADKDRNQLDLELDDSWMFRDAFARLELEYMPCENLSITPYIACPQQLDADARDYVRENYTDDFIAYAGIGLFYEF